MRHLGIIKDQFKLDYDNHDAWGSAMAWHFAVADYLHWALDSDTPSEWQYSPSPFGPDDENPQYQIIAEIGPDTEALEHFGNALHRFSQYLDSKGESY